MKLWVRVPDLHSQGAIADYLDAETARIDALIGGQQANTTATAGEQRSVLERLAHLLAEKRQALITAAVTGELSIPGVAA